MGTTMVAVAVPRWMLPAPHIDGRSVPAMYQRGLTLRPSVLEVADLVGHRELRRHLRVAHEPGVDLGDLGLLGQGVGAAPRRGRRARPGRAVESAHCDELLSDLDRGLSAARARAAQRRSTASSRALTSDPRSPSTRAPMTIWAGLKNVAALHDQVAEPGVGAHELGADDDEQGEAEAERAARRRCRAARPAAPRGGRGPRASAPRLAAARSSITSTRSTLAAMATNIGKNVV